MTCIATLRVSRHAENRLRQRGFRPRDLDLVCCYGTPVLDGFLLTREDARELTTRPDLRQRVSRLVGTIVIAQGEAIVTVFRASKARRRSLTKGGRRRHRKG